MLLAHPCYSDYKITKYVLDIVIRVITIDIAIRMLLFYFDVVKVCKTVNHAFIYVRINYNNIS